MESLVDLQVGILESTGYMKLIFICFDCPHSLCLVASLPPFFPAIGPIWQLLDAMETFPSGYFYFLHTTFYFSTVVLFYVANVLYF